MVRPFQSRHTVWFRLSGGAATGYSIRPLRGRVRMIDKMRAQRATPETVNQTIQAYEQFNEWHKNPFLRYAMTLMELSR